MADNNVDYEKLRRDLADECMAAFICGGIGPALHSSLTAKGADGIITNNKALYKCMLVIFYECFRRSFIRRI